jgi:hypothetical protein
VGVNGGGLGFSTGKSLSGLPMILRSMSNFSGSSPITVLGDGLVFLFGRDQYKVQVGLGQKSMSRHGYKWCYKKLMTWYLGSHRWINK